ncbi:hypothetical protein [Krasilnikovia sp. MM14-A1004]|uniref:hypothetical protein n=1 Tax=Krasilnikovia sp. MM14-A1004 TaxID=3373541 RepID=UPI00399D2FDF
MGRKIDTHAVTVDGDEMVAVRPADFARLDASRRQVGARTARADRLHQQLRDAHTRLAQIEAILAGAGEAECVCESIAAALRGVAQDSSTGQPVRTRRRS